MTEFKKDIKAIVISINKNFCFGCSSTTCSGSIYDYLQCSVEDKKL